MSLLYLTPLPNRDALRADKAVASDIQQAGLLGGGGTATENIATDSNALTVDGQVRDGSLLSKKVAEELDSLSESGYIALPLYGEVPNDRQRGYYEVESADVNPAKPGVEHVIEYTAQLTKKGTREDARRKVETNVDAIDSAFPDASAVPFIAIPDAATDVRWYDDAEGTTAATATDTVESEYGTVARYDPADAPTADPTLTYDLDFAEDGPTDVRVYDSRDRVKFAATASGDDVNTWVHAYHTGYQFDGAAVIDTGRFRLVLGGDVQVASATADRDLASGETFTVASGETVTDRTLSVASGATFSVESGGTHVLTGDARSDFDAARYNTTTEEWDALTFAGDPPISLEAWSLTRIRPARVVVQTLWDVDGTETRLNATLERAADGVVWWSPENATAPPTALTDLLAPTARATDEVARPTQGLIDRSDLED